MKLKCRHLLLLCFAGMTVRLVAAEPPGAGLYQLSQTLLANQPATVSQNYQQLSAQLGQTPAWYQRDWHLLAARAYAAQQQWPAAWHSLALADQLVPQGIVAADIAMTAGYLAYQQQHRTAARHWFLCADKFANPPLTRAKLLLNLGAVESFRGDYAAAMAFYQQGLALAEQHEFVTLLPMFNNNMGNLHWRLGQHEPAIAALRQATFRYAHLQQLQSQSRAGINLLNVLVTIEDWVRYQRFYPSIAQQVQKAGTSEYRLFLQILEVIRQRLTGQGSSMTNAQLQALLAQLKVLNVQQMAQQLVHKIGLNWQAPPPAPVAEQFSSQLPHTERLCPAQTPE
jgi:tetratricopeptide (TPR) repeat protein